MISYFRSIKSINDQLNHLIRADGSSYPSKSQANAFILMQKLAILLISVDKDQDKNVIGLLGAEQGSIVPFP